MRIICRGCLIGFDGRSRQQYCSTGCANRARVKSGVVLNRIPKMSKEKWADLCKRFTTKEIIANERLTGRMCVVYSKRFGIAPYQQCRNHGMLPRESFPSVNHRYCLDCSPIKQKSYDNGIDTTWLKKWSKLASQPWAHGGGFLRNHKVQGAW